MAVDLSNLYKPIFSDVKIEKYIVEKCPALAWIDRDKNFTSTTKEVAVVSNNNQRAGADFTLAKAMTGEAVYEKFVISQKKVYAFSTISGQDFTNFSEGGSESYFMNHLKMNTLGTLETITGKVAQQLYGNGTGLMGRLSAGTASPVTFEKVSSVAHIYVGLTLRFGPNADGSSLRTGTATVTNVDYDTGIVTYTGTITSLAATDYVFPATDVASSVLAQGLDAYNPETPTTLNGIDQTANTLRYSGVRFDCNASATRSGYPIEVGIPAALARHRTMAKGAGGVDAIFMNPIDIDRLSQAKVGTTPYKMGANDAYKSFELSIEGFMVNGTPVVSDPFAPEGIARGIKKGSMTWHTAGQVPKVDNRDGNTTRASGTADELDTQFFLYHNFCSQAPVGLLRIKLPT